MATGALVGLLGGMIGRGGAEFRLPLLVVLTALPARLAAVPLSTLGAQWPVVVNLLAGTLVKAWAGASWATKMRTSTRAGRDRIPVPGKLSRHPRAMDRPLGDVMEDVQAHRTAQQLSHRAARCRR